MKQILFKIGQKMLKTLLKFCLYCLKLAGKILLLGILYFVKLASFALFYIERFFERLCLEAGLVFAIETPEENIIESEPKFTDQEIDLMARKIKDEDLTLQKIQERFSISYRQAQKIRTRISALEQTPDIRQLSATIRG